MMKRVFVGANDLNFLLLISMLLAVERMLIEIWLLFACIIWLAAINRKYDCEEINILYIYIYILQIINSLLI